MSWWLALRGLCVAASIVTASASSLLAQTTAGDDDESDSEAIVEPTTTSSFLSALLLSDKPLTGLPSFAFTTDGLKSNEYLFFGGVDAWKFGVTAYGGMQWKPGPQEADGIVVRIFGSEGTERFSDGVKSTATQIIRTSILFGGDIQRGKFIGRVLAGPDSEIDTVRPNYLGSPQGLHFGARVAAEAWWEPFGAAMISASGSATTIANGYNARVATGWRLFDAFWLGPEVSVSADRFSQQTRVGAHLTGLKADEFEWSLAAGYATDSYGREGLYGRIGVSIRQ